MASPTQPKEPAPSRGPTPRTRRPTPSLPPPGPTRPPPRTDHAPPLATDDGSVADAVTGVVRSAVDALSKAGTVSAAALSDALESAGRSLSRRVVAGAATRRGMGDRDTLARALADRPHTPVLASATGAALAVKVVSRFKRLGFLAKKSPMWLLATAVPALAASVSRGADELGMVAAHLIERARARRSGARPGAGPPRRRPDRVSTSPSTPRPSPATAASPSPGSSGPPAPRCRSPPAWPPPIPRASPRRPRPSTPPCSARPDRATQGPPHRATPAPPPPGTP